MKTKRRPNYSIEEVEALVENYQVLSFYLRHKRYIQVRLMDVERSLPLILPAEAMAVFLCGIMEFTVREAARQVGVSKDTMHRRYLKGMELLFARINGI